MSVETDELNNDLRTAYTEQDEQGIKEYMGQAVIDILLDEDEDYFADALADAASFIQRLYSEIPKDMPKDMQCAPVWQAMYCARIWKALEKKIEDQINPDLIRRRAEELWKACKEAAKEGGV